MHQGEAETEVRQELMDSLRQIPYGEVVLVEQELISEGLPVEEVLRLCDTHSAVLRGNVDQSEAQEISLGHPVDVMVKENIELNKVISQIKELLNQLTKGTDDNFAETILQLRGLFNNLQDVDKHYLRKEYLLFPYLENKGITGPPKVMWGKHDEIRELLQGSAELLQTEGITQEELLASAQIVLQPVVENIAEMVDKEEEILFPMALDELTEEDWFEISKQSLEIGYCLYDPPQEWHPEWATKESINDQQKEGSSMQLPSGSFEAEEILAIMNAMPVDITFVDRHDKVKYFSRGIGDHHGQRQFDHHPTNQVMADLKKMTAGSIYKVKAPFLPAPLIDKALSLKIGHWVVQQGEEDFAIYFYKGKG